MGATHEPSTGDQHDPDPFSLADDRPIGDDDLTPPVNDVPPPEPADRAPKAEATRAEAKAILAYLNQVTGHRWGSRDRQSEDAALKEILSRVRAGATAEEGRLVIDWCMTVKEAWYPGFVKQYLNPVTPFRKTHYENYRGSAELWEAQGRPLPRPTLGGSVLDNPRTRANIAGGLRALERFRASMSNGGDYETEG
jgi:uncharacterized phage protein (TIGR02220 family)